MDGIYNAFIDEVVAQNKVVSKKYLDLCATVDRLTKSLEDRETDIAVLALLVEELKNYNKEIAAKLKQFEPQK